MTFRSSCLKRKIYMNMYTVENLHKGLLICNIFQQKHVDFNKNMIFQHKHDISTNEMDRRYEERFRVLIPPSNIMFNVFVMYWSRCISGDTTTTFVIGLYDSNSTAEDN